MTKLDGHWLEGVFSAERQWDVQSKYGKFHPWGSLTAAAVKNYGHQQGSDENSTYFIDNALESEYTVFIVFNCSYASLAIPSQLFKSRLALILLYYAIFLATCLAILL